MVFDAVGSVSITRGIYGVYPFICSGSFSSSQRLGFIVSYCVYHIYVVTASFYVVLYCYKSGLRENTNIQSGFHSILSVIVASVSSFKKTKTKGRT